MQHTRPSPRPRTSGGRLQYPLRRSIRVISSVSSACAFGTGRQLVACPARGLRQWRRGRGTTPPPLLLPRGLPCAPRTTRQPALVCIPQSGPARAAPVLRLLPQKCTETPRSGGFPMSGPTPRSIPNTYPRAAHVFRMRAAAGVTEFCAWTHVKRRVYVVLAACGWGLLTCMGTPQAAWPWWHALHCC